LENNYEEAQWDQVKEMVKIKWKHTSDEEIWEEFKGWSNDPIYSYTHESKFFGTMEIYWHGNLLAW
jgi:hypothetical protein